MVTDQQVRRLYMLIKRERNIEIASAKAGMSEKTGRKYKKLGQLPSQIIMPHTWQTREDPFAEIWPEAKGYLETEPGLEAKTLFEHIQGKYPGRYEDGQVRTFQRRVKVWRATEGPAKEIFFPQIHLAGEICESDFTHMTELGVTINKELFAHLLYHFVLTYSNWETGSICFSESYESLSEGFQDALWELGGVPEKHRIDRMSAAIHKDCNRGEFTQRYHGLLGHYGIMALVTQAGKAHEKGDIEQRHHRLKRAVNQALLLRGSREFGERDEYQEFLKKMFSRLNAGRQKRFEEEIKELHALPLGRLDDRKSFRVEVGPHSTIRVLHNTYSVDSRLKGEQVNVRVSSEYLDVWYGQKHLERIPRLFGKRKDNIQYRHIIDWMVRKPGAFRHYKYQPAMFPSTVFRMAYDKLRQQNPAIADKQYLEILYVAAKESEQRVEQSLREHLDCGQSITLDSIRSRMESELPEQIVPKVQEPQVDLAEYDRFLNGKEVAICQA